MKWFKRNPKPKYLPEHMLYPTDRIDRIKPKEESRVSENVKGQAEPFIPEDYKSQHFGWMSPFTSEEKMELKMAESPAQFERITGKLLYKVEQRRSEEAAKEAAIAAEKAKTHWAQVMTYDNPHPIEGQADKLNDFMDMMYSSHKENEFRMVPIHTFQDGTIFVKLKDIRQIHFTKEYMEGRISRDTDKPNTN